MLSEEMRRCATTSWIKASSGNIRKQLLSWADEAEAVEQRNKRLCSAMKGARPHLWVNHDDPRNRQVYCTCCGCAYAGLHDSDCEVADFDAALRGEEEKDA